MTAPPPPPFPGSPYPPPPHGWQTPYAPPPRNGLGTAALVLGILGALFSLIPIIGVVAWPMVILGLVLGTLGIVRAQAGRADNRGVAITGTVLSGVGLAFCLLYTAAFASTFPADTSSTSATNNTGSTGGVVQNADRTSTAPTPPTSGAPGDVLATRSGLQVSADPLADRSAFMGPVKCTEVTYRNTGSATESFNIWDWKLQDPAGAIRNISLGSDNDLSSGELAPGGTVSGQVCFDVKSSAQGTWTVIYEGGLFGSQSLTWASS